METKPTTTKKTYSKYKLTANGKTLKLSQPYTNLNAAKYEIRKVNKINKLNNNIIIF